MRCSRNPKTQPPALPFESVRCREKTRAYIGTLVRVYQGIRKVGEARVLDMDLATGMLYVRWVEAKSYIVGNLAALRAADCKALEG